MTKINAVKFAIYNHFNKFQDEVDRDVIIEKDGEYGATTWDELNRAENFGWKYVNTAASIARNEYGVKVEDLKAFAQPW